MKAKFAKGQKVYYASVNVSRIYKTNADDIVLCMVIERTVDSCGAKRMTFEDDGYDFVFGKSVHMDYASSYFATPEAAFAYLSNYSHHRCTPEIYPQVVSDKSRDWFSVANEWKNNNQPH